MVQVTSTAEMVDSEAGGAMEWETPFDFGLGQYSNLNTASNGLQSGDLDPRPSPGPQVFGSHAEQFSIPSEGFPESGVGENQPRSYHGNGVAQPARQTEANENSPIFGTSASQANTFDFENLLVS